MLPYKMTPEEKEFLAGYDMSKYDRPSLTADIAVFAILTEAAEEKEDYRREPRQRVGILLIKRGGFPYKDYWALPGGFAMKDETLPQTAMRELQEETGVERAYLEPFGVFSTPGRDPRGWVVSQGFLALIDAAGSIVQAGSDAGEADWFMIDIEQEEMKKHVQKSKAEIRTRFSLSLQSPVTGEKLTSVVEQIRKFEAHHENVSYQIIEQGGLAFDHAQIIVRAFLSLKERAQDAGRIVFDLMPEKFTLYSLQEAYEIILGEKLTTPNFRRKIAPYVIETDESVTGAGHRPAKLFKRNLEKFYG